MRNKKREIKKLVKVEIWYSMNSVGFPLGESIFPLFKGYLLPLNSGGKLKLTAVQWDEM